MDKLMLIFMLVIAGAFLLGMALDDIVLTVAAVGYAIIWSAFHLGDKLDSR